MEVTPQDKETIVCFDLGGVLVRICHTWNEAAEAAGINAPHLTSVKMLNDCPALVDYQVGNIGEEQFANEAGEWLGVSAEEAVRIHKAVLKTDYPGAADLIESIKSAGYWTCCFSNTNALHWEVLIEPGKHPSVLALDERFASHGHMAAKPYPAAFEKIRAMFPSPTAEVIFFDDTLENIYGAAEAGWTAFKIDPAGDPIHEETAILTRLGILKGTLSQ